MDAIELVYRNQHSCSHVNRHILWERSYGESASEHSQSCSQVFCSMGRDWPVKNPLTTNSTGKTLHFCIRAALGSGTESRALGTMCLVWSIHQQLVWFSTWPCTNPITHQWCPLSKMQTVRTVDSQEVPRACFSFHLRASLQILAFRQWSPVLRRISNCDAVSSSRTPCLPRIWPTYSISGPKPSYWGNFISDTLRPM